MCHCLRMRPPSPRTIIGVVGFVWGLLSELLYYRAGVAALAEVLLDLAIGLTYLYGGPRPLGKSAGEPDRSPHDARRAAVVHRQCSVSPTWAGLRTSRSSLSETAAVALIALVLVYPTGRLETRLDRATVGILAIGFTAHQCGPIPAPAAGHGQRSGRNTDGSRWRSSPGSSSSGDGSSRRVGDAGAAAGPGRRIVLLAVLVIGLVGQAVAVPEELAAFLDGGAGILAPAAIPLALLVGLLSPERATAAGARRRDAGPDGPADARRHCVSTSGGEHPDLLTRPVESLIGAADRRHPARSGSCGGGVGGVRRDRYGWAPEPRRLHGDLDRPARLRGPHHAERSRTR